MLKRLAIWTVAAIALTFPAVLGGELIGDPRGDVWNHAWGFWYVAEALGRGELPLHTLLAGGPDGGTLWFIDTPGAVLMSPVTWLLGPAFAYNLVLIGCLLYTSPSPRDRQKSRMPSSA